MIAAEVRSAFLGAGGLLSDSNHHAGFSFQISDTPPPARAQDKTPLAELELDMRDFGEVTEPALPRPGEGKRAESAWLDEPVREASPKVDPPARSDDDAPKAPGVLAEVPSVRERLAPSARIASSHPGSTAPPTAQRKAERKGARPIPKVPEIKKIAFPAALHKTSADRRVQENLSTASRTKFSKSISAQHPRPPLDSEPEQESESDEAPVVSTAGKVAEMAPPEDLPSDEDFLPANSPPTWASDTPSAREIWKKARTTWHTASQHAAALSGQGLRKSRALAETVHDKVRERLREASEERAFRAQLKSEKVQVAPQDQIFTEPQPSTASASPSMAGRAILGLTRSAARKVAAPASAVAAAAIVYFAGSHLLGKSPAIDLSKHARGPEVPELGTLDSAQEQETTEKSKEQTAPSGESRPESEKPSLSAPPAMETEVTEMPQGMSWPGKGLIEVVTSQDELVYVDGVFTGRGPLRRIPVSPGEHEVSIRADGKERKGSVKVVADKNTRAVFKGP